MARILIVDDDAHTVRIMSLWLTRQGHEIIEARDGQIALNLLDSSQDPIDLIVSDVNMPAVNGLELLRRVREELELNMPFLMLSSRCDQTALTREIKPYWAHLYPKPFVPSRLVVEIDQLLAEHHGSFGANVESWGVRH